MENAVYIFEDLPFRGTPPNLKNGDSPGRRPIKCREAHTRIFLTNSPEDMLEYQKVWDKLSKLPVPWAIFGAEEKQYDPEIKAWRIFLRWAEVYFRMPTENGQ